METKSLPRPLARCLTKEEAADYLGIGVTLLSELNVPSVRLGRRCVYDRVDLDGWLDVISTSVVHGTEPGVRRVFAG
jgi:hypothetical protein